MKHELSKEKIQWLHDACEEAAAAGIKLTMNPNELLMFTSALLAAHEQEPVGWIVHAHGGDQLTHDGGYVANAEGMHGIHSTPLYTHPAPSIPAAVPDFDTIALGVAKDIMCDVNRRHEFLGGDIQLLSRIQCRIDDAIRAALGSPGASPR